MTKLTDIVDPSRFKAFVEGLKAQPANPEALLQAEQDLKPVLLSLTCSDGVSPACECSVGTLLLIDLYLKEQNAN